MVALHNCPRFLLTKQDEGSRAAEQLQRRGRLHRGDGGALSMLKASQETLGS